MRRLVILLLPFTLACSLLSVASPTPDTPATPSSAAYAYASLGLTSLTAYRATFELHFAGTYGWSYHLETRVDGDRTEYRLCLEGVADSDDPGDVRAVVEGETIRVRGPGTDDECLQFPGDLDLGTSFLPPDDVISPAELPPLLPVGAELVAGTETTRYTLDQATLGEWRDLAIDLWLDETNAVVLRHEIQATGPDPLYDASEGTLSGRFEVIDVGPQTIDPIAGCEIDLPLPADATRLVRLPGLIAFDSRTGPAEIVAFYQVALAEAGWEAAREPQIDADTAILSYSRNGRTLEVEAEATTDGAHVEMLTGDN